MKQGTEVLESTDKALHIGGVSKRSLAIKWWNSLKVDINYELRLKHLNENPSKIGRTLARFLHSDKILEIYRCENVC